SNAMNDWASLGIGSIGEAVFSKLLKVVIDEAKKFKAFKPLSKDLVSTMEILFPLTQKIDSMQKELDFGVKELKELRDTIERADVAVRKFPRVKWYEESEYTEEIEEINEDMLEFCQIDLQLLQHRNQWSHPQFEK
uniref:Probable disease resistance protein At5g66900 n=1 Tax=Arabidopsis thaliana TaxID=3702 RepID=UPI001C0A6748|nr:Chain A, Probable disease resistance protein At5g66900 [Arabidopsis thaliana]7L7V_B Chain B, Probable disease resistance protein At5g66900 [Arabidopsis thaliana]7L7V_C Chain C, Probable disease resistance protein At5g66900 [Arabidopsis thaliana]7L7V_D Chain D, Probable disease resistance protein At5g66900 [Arabidopsis thaliana]7L7V_E Chain E, Probable disease resistance protein At5g66900 [Arabidopsis thaliana]7L7V_F Chain F, Probable disease resistance protein At5g66900 [Arabidopsis thalian